MLESFTQIATIIGVLLLLRSVLDTYRTVRANAYFAIMNEINGKENLEQIDKLKKLIDKPSISILNADKWPKDAIKLARIISNRYQIVAHLVERDFLSKAVFLENFSGTMMDVWNSCAPYIQMRRTANNNSRYLRRDLERLALQCFLYQVDAGFDAKVTVLDLDSKHPISELNESRQKEIKRLIRSQRRQLLTWVRLKTMVRSIGF
jgi:Domain of unknown function (DUF4760)